MRLALLRLDDLFLPLFLLASLACGGVTNDSLDAAALDGALDAEAMPVDAGLDARTDCGASMTEPGRTCRSIKRSCGAITSGPRWITAGGPTAFQAYCDMDDASDGGGWTLFAKNEMSATLTWAAWRNGSLNTAQLTSPIVADLAYFRISAFDGLGTDEVTLRQQTDVGRTSFWVLSRAATVSARINAVEVRFGDFSNVQYVSGSLANPSVPLAAADPGGSAYEHVLHERATSGVRLSAFGSNGQAKVFGSCTSGLDGIQTWGHSATLWIREGL